MIRPKNNEHIDLMLLAKYQYGPVNNHTLLTMVRILVAIHVGLNPLTTSLLTFPAIASKLADAVLKVYGPAIHTKDDRLLVKLASAFAEDRMKGIGELFHLLTIVEHKDFGGLMFQQADPGVKAEIDRVLAHLKWIDELKPGDRVQFVGGGEVAQGEYEIISIHLNDHRGEAPSLGNRLKFGLKNIYDTKTMASGCDLKPVAEAVEAKTDGA